MIIQEPSSIPTQFFYNLSKKVLDGNRYYADILSIQQQISSEFPLLSIVLLPTREMTTGLIKGILLPQYDIKELYILPEQYEEFGLQIFAQIPENFRVRGVQVYDASKRINWGEIPDEYRHNHPQTKKEKQFGMVKICTHKDEYINESNCIINVLYSAYYLFKEYQKYDQCNNFDLECLPHGELTRREKRIGSRRTKS